MVMPRMTLPGNLSDDISYLAGAPLFRAATEPLLRSIKREKWMLHHGPILINLALLEPFKGIGERSRRVTPHEWRSGPRSGAFVHVLSGYLAVLEPHLECRRLAHVPQLALNGRCLRARIAPPTARLYPRRRERWLHVRNLQHDGIWPSA